jgi:hypothetical protein
MDWALGKLIDFAREEPSSYPMAPSKIAFGFDSWRSIGHAISRITACLIGFNITCLGKLEQARHFSQFHGELHLTAVGCNIGRICSWETSKMSPNCQVGTPAGHQPDSWASLQQSPCEVFGQHIPTAHLDSLEGSSIFTARSDTSRSA